MKKLKYITIVLLILLFAYTPIAHAEPTPSPSPTASPSPSASPSPAAAASGSSSSGFTGLITFKSTGEVVVRVQLRLRELGYFNFKPTGNFQSMSVESTIKFQQMQVDENGQGIMADGSIGAQTMDILFSRAAKRADIVASIPIGPNLDGTPAVTGELLQWSSVKEMLKEGASYTVTDYNTGTTFTLKYVGGENHAEMECACAEDTAKMLTVFGEKFNYSKRSVVITIDGKNVAASLQGWPHGEDAVAQNDMSGHLCMFFDGSLSHVGMLPDVEHIKLVYKAAGK